MRVTPGRCRSLEALAEPRACAFPDGVTTSGYRITSDILDILGRNGMIQESHLSDKSRKKQRIVFVYTITEAGREWLDRATNPREIGQPQHN